MGSSSQLTSPSIEGGKSQGRGDGNIMALPVSLPSCSPISRLISLNRPKKGGQLTSKCNTAFARHIFPLWTRLWACRCSSVALLDGPFDDMPLSRERSSALGKGRTWEGRGPRGESGEEKSTDVAGRKDLEIDTGLASWVADDLLRTLAGGVDTSTGTGVRTVDKVPPKSASGATHAVTKHCCVLLSRG
jgi:hypothetical protein